MDSEDEDFRRSMERFERQYPHEEWHDAAEMRMWTRAFNQPVRSADLWNPEREAEEGISQAEAWRRVLHRRFLMQLQVDLAAIEPPTRSDEGMFAAFRERWEIYLQMLRQHGVCMVPPPEVVGLPCFPRTQESAWEGLSWTMERCKWAADDRLYGWRTLTREMVEGREPMAEFRADLAAFDDAIERPKYQADPRLFLDEWDRRGDRKARMVGTSRAGLLLR